MPTVPQLPAGSTRPAAASVVAIGPSRAPAPITARPSGRTSTPENRLRSTTIPPSTVE
jgi:hypothetical protein